MGTVSKNVSILTQLFAELQLDRVRLAEDRFLQDMIDAEYASGDEVEVEESGDESGKRMKDERKAQARQRALIKSRALSTDQLTTNLLEDGPIKGKSQVVLVPCLLKQIPSARYSRH